MATRNRKKITTTTVEEPADEPKEEAADSDLVTGTDLNEERAAVLVLMSELAGVSNARVVVYRATRNKPLAYCFECSPDTFSLDDLRDKYNGGDFRVYVSRDGKPLRNLKVSVEPGKKIEPEAPALSDVAIAMRDGFAQQAEVLRESLESRNSGGISLRDVLMQLPAIIAAWKSLQPAPPPPMEDKIDVLLKGMEMAREFGGGGGGDSDSLMGILRDLIRSPMVAQAVQSTLAQQAQKHIPVAPQAAQPQILSPELIARGNTPLPPVQWPHRPEDRAMPPASPAPVQPSEGNGMIHPMLKHYLGVLVQKAADNSDPALYADVILDNAPPDQIQTLLMQRPTPVEYLIGIEPRIAQHREWFSSLMGTLFDAITAPPDDAEGTESTGSTEVTPKTP
jgi:hypothetical protein